MSGIKREERERLRAGSSAEDGIARGDLQGEVVYEKFLAFVCAI
jgi:hypothetical protein